MKMHCYIFMCNMKAKSPISYSNKVMAKVKVFVQASHADADGRDVTLAPRTYDPAR